MAKTEPQNQGGAPEDEPLLPDPQAAKLLGWHVGTLRNKRVTGDGPPYVKLGKSVRYRPADLREYVAQRVRQSTAEAAGDAS